MFSTCLKLARPTKVFDGQSPCEVIEQTREIYCDPIVGDSQPKIAVNSEEDIRVGDLVFYPISHLGTGD